MIGKIINSKYEIITLKGAGGFGAVYEIRDISSGESYAMKVCISKDQEITKRFARESRLMAAIDHPNVVKLIEAELDTDEPYIVMPLAKGSLEKYLPNLMANSLSALKAFLVICEGIKAIHVAGQIHRDIKLANVLVLQDNTLVISDLGLGVFETRESTILTSSNIYMGTEGYIPPEFKTSGGTKRADQRSDVYQLGKMLYNILTGEDPILIDETSLTPTLIYIIKKATKDRSLERYQSVAQLMDAISNYIASLDPYAHPIKAFETNISAAIDMVKQGSYDKNIIHNIILSLKSSEKDSKQFFEMIDKIPYDLVAKMVTDFEDETKEILNFYKANLDNYVSNNGLGFQYAEKIADIMEVVYRISRDSEVKCDALRNILKTGYYYNRFYSMDVFDNILTRISEDSEAKEIAKMLYEEPDAFLGRIENLPYSELHPEIRTVVDYFRAKPPTSPSDLSSYEDLFLE